MTPTALALAAAAFVAGYLLGRMETLLAVLRGQTHSAPQGFFAKTKSPEQAPLVANIEIDERKVVSQIDTNSLQNVTQIQLGKQVVAADDINASVNKLAALKRS